jgi:DNA adenine methylase
MTPFETTGSTNRVCVPFLKWAGGKRWLAYRHLDIIPSNYRCYFEPFLGSGAIFFALRPRKAVLSDLNTELVETFLAIRGNWKAVAERLRRYQRLHSNEFYYAARRSNPRVASARAARFIYLNRTCWNGLYRVNLRGEFNVPKGTKEHVVLATDDFEAVHDILQNARVVSSDFEPIIDMAGKRDLIFADPPYITSHVNNGFLKYNERLFSWNDQVRLRNSLVKAARRGAHIVATNANTAAIRSLYEKDFTVATASRASVIAGSSLWRGTKTELIVNNC